MEPLNPLASKVVALVQRPKFCVAEVPMLHGVFTGAWTVML